MNQIEKKAVLSKLVNDFQRCLISPTNPFSIDDPDAIVVNNNSVFAIYIPTFLERENYDHLLRRLHMSQLSYSLKFVPVLLLDQDDKMSDIGWFMMKNNFVFVAHSLDDAEAFIKKSGKINRKWKEINHFQQEHILSYNINSKVSTLISKEITTPYEKLYEGKRNRFELQGLTSDKLWGIQDFHPYQNGMIGEKNKSKSSFLNSFQKMMTASFMCGFVIDNGYLFPSPNAYDGIVNIVNTNWNLFEEERPNRYNSVLSFCGLVPVCISSEDHIEIINDVYQTVRRDVVKK